MKSWDTLTADNQYSLRDSEILPQPILMQISKKRIAFSQYFSLLLKSTSHFKHFEKKGDPHSLYICEIMECERRALINV